MCFCVCVCVCVSVCVSVSIINCSPTTSQDIQCPELDVTPSELLTAPPGGDYEESGRSERVGSEFQVDVKVVANACAAARGCVEVTGYVVQTFNVRSECSFADVVRFKRNKTLHSLYRGKRV